MLHNLPISEDQDPELTDELIMCIQDSIEAFMMVSGQLKERGFGQWRSELRRVRRDMLFGEQGEATEFQRADMSNDVVEFVDGALDMIVVLWGTLFKTVGPVTAAECAEEVNRSNLDKINGKYGPVVWAGEPYESKVLKPQGWKAPDIRGVLLRHGWEFDEFGRIKEEGDML